MLADAALADESQDQLGFKAFADALAGVIDSPRTSTPLVLAINAKWGAGKTTLGRMIKRRLEAKPAVGGNAPHVTCWFNSWVHDQSPSLATSLAAEVAQVANRFRASWRRVIAPLPSTVSSARDRRIRKGLKYFGLLLVLAAACIIVSLKLGSGLSDVVRLDPKVMKSLAGLQGGAYLAALVVAALLLFKTLVGILPVAKSVAAFVSDPRSTANTASMPEVRSQLGKLIRQATPKKSKFVIFVDDLDRCRPPSSVDVLEAVNQLLDHSQVVVVMMADMHVVAKCAEIKYRSLEKPVAPGEASHSEMEFSAYGWNYIQKIIQLQFDLPVYPASAIRGLIESLVKRVPEERTGGGFGLIRTKLESTLRRIQSTFTPLESARAFRNIFFLLVASLGVGWALNVQLRARVRLEPREIAHVTLVMWALTAATAGIACVALLPEIYTRIRDAARRRKVDRQIRARVAAGERDFASVEASIRMENRSAEKNPRMEGILRERLQRYLEDESEIQREAEDEVMRYLEPLPRHAKRLLNRLRLLLFVAHERKMFGGRPTLNARHIGKWAVLCERWPELAQAVSSDSEVMHQLEDDRKHGAVISRRAPLYKGDEALREFCLSEDGLRLGPLMQRILEFAPASSARESTPTA